MLFLEPNLIFIALSSLIIFLFWLFVFVIFYHLVRFGIGTQPKVGAAIFVLGSFTLFFMSILFFSNIDWNNIINKLT
jgi:hypothetical protein